MIPYDRMETWLATMLHERGYFATTEHARKWTARTLDDSNGSVLKVMRAVHRMVTR